MHLGHSGGHYRHMVVHLRRGYSVGNAAPTWASNAPPGRPRARPSSGKTRRGPPNGGIEVSNRGKAADEPVFTTRQGNLVRNRVFRDRVWLPACQKLEWSPRPRIHDLRHTHVSHADRGWGPADGHPTAPRARLHQRDIGCVWASAALGGGRTRRGPGQGIRAVGRHHDQTPCPHKTRR